MSSLVHSVALLACLIGLAASTEANQAQRESCDSDGASAMQLSRGGDSELPLALRCANWLKNQKQPSGPCPTPAPCPYNFEPPACEVAEPQAPRDLTPGAVGDKTPKAATLNANQADFVPLTNIHFHLGAEHKSMAYSNSSCSEAWDACTKDPEIKGKRPGFMCPIWHMKPWQFAPYQFKHCGAGVAVGKTYEVHYVHSSAGYSDEDLDGIDGVDPIDDGLGGAANGRGILNPMIVVEALVFQIVQGAEDLDAFHGWQTVADHKRSVMYQGSTTGTSYNNTICSPYSITWHVDKTCHRISPKGFDDLCKGMDEVYGLKEDLKAKDSRVLLNRKWVVKDEFVVPYN